MARAGYIAQVGLDFGTSFSKCIVRDIGSGIARVVEGHRLVAGLPFLFPSTIGFANQMLVKRIDRAGDQLLFAKMFITTLARGRKLSGWSKYVEDLPSDISPIDGVTLAAAWLLAPILSEARVLAKRMMPGFGNQDDDVFSVNLCVPVDDMQEQAVLGPFEKIVDLAWRISMDGTLPEGIKPAEVRDALNRCPAPEQGLCNLYAEIAADVQAFLKSGFADQYWGIPFFMTDVGSGTVDQSYFILSPDLGRLTFLAASVQALGSSEIETRCSQDHRSNPEAYRMCIEQVRLHKEGLGPLPLGMASKFAETIASLQDEIVQMTWDCSSAGRRTPDGEELLTRTQFGNTVLMNAGGGMRDEPYRQGIQIAFNQHWNLFPDAIELPRPNDLLRADGRALPREWFRRLAVAYGLSFSPAELHQITLPDAVLPLDEIRNLSTGDYGPGRCRSCGRPAIYGHDYCSAHG